MATHPGRSRALVSRGDRSPRRAPAAQDANARRAPAAREGTPGDLAGNAAIALRKATSENDRANVAYWLTWPDSPRKISSSDKANAKRWLAARDEVRRQASGKIAGEAVEVRNAALAVDATPPGPGFVQRALETARQATPNASPKIVQHVQRGARLARKLGAAPANWPLPNGKRWLPFAIALACASGARDPETLRRVVAEALANLRARGGSGGDGEVDLGSIIAQGAQWQLLGKEPANLDEWMMPATRAYMAAAELL